MGASDHVAEGTQIFFGEPALHGGEYTGDLTAAAEHLRVVKDIFGLRDARDRNLFALQAFDVLRVLLGGDQFVVAAAHEIQQVVQELGNISRANVVFEVQFADAAAQVNPQILVVEDTEIFVDALEHVETIVVEGGGVHLLAAQQFAKAVAHFIGCISRIGEGQDLVGVSVSLADQALNALSQDGSLASASARDHQHGSMDVLDGFALAIVGSKRSGTGVRLRRRH